MSYERELALAHQWCDETDAIALDYFTAGALTEIKADGTPVTAGDRAVERALRRSIESAFPTDAVLGEEEGLAGRSDRRWILDPIDGTKNYARGVPVFATLLALQEQEETVVGMVSAPALGTRWWASRGDGAHASGTIVRVSSVASIAESHLITGGVDWAGDRADALVALLARAKRHRGFGDFWGHMLVAQGSAEAMIELAPLAVWDIAAPKIIVEEAGGRVSALDGGDAGGGGAVVSSNGAVHDDILAALSG
ncbi:MAG TPA: inositol monophosphatase family protein [Actinomycetota bacterium]